MPGLCPEYRPIHGYVHPHPMYTIDNSPPYNGEQPKVLGLIFTPTMSSITEPYHTTTPVVLVTPFLERPTYTAWMLCDVLSHRSP